jgi:ribosomal protein S18 acetylase RimI-like enzyme
MCATFGSGNWDIYIDDLVTAAADRSQGVGNELLAYLLERARQAGCTTLDLDPGVQRSGAHRFYMRERMAVAAFHFSRALPR